MLDVDVGYCTVLYSQCTTDQHAAQSYDFEDEYSLNNCFKYIPDYTEHHEKITKWHSWRKCLPHCGTIADTAGRA